VRLVRVVAAVVAAVTVLALVSLTNGLASLGSPSHGRASAAELVSSSPTEALETMLTALGTGDVVAACAVAAPDGFPIRTADARDRCAADLRDRLDVLDPRVLKAYREVDVLGAFVEGNSATVRPAQIADAPVAMRKAVFVLVESGGAWYVVV
jgi:hypothetical protein